MRIWPPSDAARSFVPLTRIKISPLLTDIKDQVFAEVAREGNAWTIELISTARNDDSRTNFKRLGEHIVYRFDRTEEKLRGILEHCVPREFSLSGGELPGAIRVIFNLRLELHLLHVRNKLRSWFVSELSEVLMNGVAFDEANFRIELRADVFIDSNESIEIILKDRFQPRRPGTR